MKVVIDIATGEIVEGPARSSYPRAQGDPSQAIIPAYGWDESDIRYWKAIADHSGIEKKSQSEIDAIIAADLAKEQAQSDRIAGIRDKLTNLTPAQVSNYIDNNVTNLAGAVTYLKRLTLVVRDIAIELKGE